MADERNTAGHRYYARENAIGLGRDAMSRDTIFASAVSLIDDKIIRQSLFAASEPGAWYDPSDLTTLYQDTAGQTPVTAAGQSVALVLDKSRGSLAPRRNLYRYSQTMTNSSWEQIRATVAASGTISTPRGTLPYFKVTATGNDPQLPQTVTTGPVANRTFTLSFVAWTDAGQPTEAALFFFGMPGVEQVKTVNITLTTIPTVYTLTGSFTGAAASSTVTARIDLKDFPTVGDYIYVTAAQFEEGASASAYQETADFPVAWGGNHATQSTAASRPLYALHPSSGIRNLALGSADVGNATSWPTTQTVNGVTYTRIASGTDTDGLPYNDWTVVGTASALSEIIPYASTPSRTSAASGQTFTTSFLARIIAGTPPVGASGVRADIIGETAPSTFTEISASAVFNSATEGVVSRAFTLANGATNQARGQITIRTEASVSVNYTVRLKALQFERGSARTNYQFNYSATNIVEAPFAQVGNLLFDGVDDFLVTPTITPATDKVQVFAGVRRLTDTPTNGLVVEHGDVSVSATGTLTLHAPGANIGSYGGASRGSLSVSASSAVASFPAPDSAVLTLVGDIAGDVLQVRRNGSQAAETFADQGSGNYAAAQMWIGRRGGTTLPFNGRLYGLVVRFGPNLDAGTISATESWMNSKTGAY